MMRILLREPVYLSRMVRPGAELQVNLAVHGWRKAFI